MKILQKILNKLRGVQDLEKLKKRGLKIGKNPTIMGGVFIDPSHCWHIEIGDNARIAPNVHIFAHDSLSKTFTNYSRVANVKIGNNVFIGSGAVILPGVTIGNNTAIGSGSVVSKDIPDNSLAVGVPAKVICTLDEYLQKENARKNEKNTFSEEYTLRNKDFSEKHKMELLKSCEKYKEIFVE
ncbi:MAG: acyltransferase [Prevotellaceae bacterium]|jgi:maltose O-acetyltransferase|nr:acyltransferase [Prevotellaceae bacterium]